MKDLIDSVSGLFSNECCLLAAILAFVVLLTVRAAFAMVNKQAAMLSDVIKEAKK